MNQLIQQSISDVISMIICTMVINVASEIWIGAQSEQL